MRIESSHAALPPRPDAETALVHLAREGVLESFPLPDGMRRFVAWDAGGADDTRGAGVDDARAARAARSGQRTAATPE